MTRKQVLKYLTFGWFQKVRKHFLRKVHGVPLGKLACLRAPCTFLRRYIRRMF